MAINLIKLRLKDMYGLEAPKDYKVIGEPEDLSAAEELAHYNRFQFQWWATSLIEARPYGDKKRGADTGIDGLMFFMDGKEDVKKVIVSVKSGKVSVKDIRDLCHVIDREDAVIGIFVTLEPPTKPMVKEAMAKGFYKSTITGKNYPKIQILTVKDMLDGKKPNVPEYYALPGFKKAQAQKTETKSEKLNF